MAWLQTSFTNQQILRDKATTSNRKGYLSNALDKNADQDNSDTPLLFDLSSSSAKSSSTDTVSSTVTHELDDEGKLRTIRMEQTEQFRGSASESKQETDPPCYLKKNADHDNSDTPLLLDLSSAKSSSRNTESSTKTEFSKLDGETKMRIIRMELRRQLRGTASESMPPSYFSVMDTKKEPKSSFLPSDFLDRGNGSSKVKSGTTVKGPKVDQSKSSSEDKTLLNIETNQPDFEEDDSDDEWGTFSSDGYQRIKPCSD